MGLPARRAPWARETRWRRRAVRGRRFADSGRWMISSESGNCAAAASRKTASTCRAMSLHQFGGKARGQRADQHAPARSTVKLPEGSRSSVGAGLRKQVQEAHNARTFFILSCDLLRRQRVRPADTEVGFALGRPGRRGAAGRGPRFVRAARRCSRSPSARNRSRLCRDQLAIRSGFSSPRATGAALAAGFIASTNSTPSTCARAASGDAAWLRRAFGPVAPAARLRPSPGPIRAAARCRT